MNDEWSRCPICFEDYSLTHRPTTFVCGHSTCIEHTGGPNRLQYCPICRFDLRNYRVHHVSYNLEEASRLFQAIKHKIDWSTIQLPSSNVNENPQDGASTLLKQDELFARRLQAQINAEAQRTSQATAPIPPAVSTQLPQPQSRPQAQPVAIGRAPKNCGHACDMNTTRQCCTCSDRRPHSHNNLYRMYLDGVGDQMSATRNQWYCPTCKQR